MTSRSVTHMLVSWILILILMLLFLFEFRGIMEFYACNFTRENSNTIEIHFSTLENINEIWARDVVK